MIGVATAAHGDHQGLLVDQGECKAGKALHERLSGPRQARPREVSFNGSHPQSKHMSGPL